MIFDKWKKLFAPARSFWMGDRSGLFDQETVNAEESSTPRVPGELRAQAIVDLRRESGWAFELLFRPEGVPTESYYRYAHLRPTGLEELLDINRQVVEAARCLQAERRMVTLNVHELLLARANLALVERWQTLNPALTVFELSERMSPELTQFAHQVLYYWRRDGYRYVIDDFDLSWQHFQLLFRAQPDGIKVERDVIRRAATEPQVRLALRTLATMCHSLGVLVIAEGVDDRFQADGLGRAVGLMHHQAYAYHVPEPYLEAARNWTSSWATPPEAFGKTRWTLLGQEETRAQLERLARSAYFRGM